MSGDVDSISDDCGLFAMSCAVKGSKDTILKFHGLSRLMKYSVAVDFSRCLIQVD